MTCTCVSSRIDTDECASDIDNCQQTCVNTDGSYECACTVGYVLDDDARTCNDVDECAQEPSPCQHRCLNDPGSRELSTASYS